MKTSIVIVFMVVCGVLTGQTQERLIDMYIDSQLVSALLIEGDTMILAELDKVTVTSPRSFSDKEDYRRYRYYKKCAAKVYPYATQAIKVLADLERETTEMKRGKKKKYAKRRKKELEANFEEPLKNLTKIQGMILVSMIEKELDRSMHEMIKEYRGWVPAAYWNTSGALFGYKLKEKYAPGNDEILDAVLNDFDISLESQTQ